MTGIPLVIAFVIAIILMIVAISKWKIHPFLSIMSVSLLLAIVAGIDLAQIADVIGAGFSGTFTSIGIVIILGAMVGTLLEKTGAALKMADCVVKLVGKKHPEAAMIIMAKARTVVSYILRRRRDEPMLYPDYAHQTAKGSEDLTFRFFAELLEK